MAPPNPLREALATGRFCYVVELVATRLTREAKLLDVASQLAQVPGLVAGSITSYAGGALGHDPIRVGTAARARGLTPNIHLTCVNRDRAGAQRALEDLHALGLENVLALTGDYPKSTDGNAQASFELDSVQLLSMIQEMRLAGMRFCAGVAVSPFKYIEADCVYQYLKLEKKIAAGADYAVTQVGFDARKFRELKQYLDGRGLRTPMLGNVYVLPMKAAEKMAKGEPPGCWVAPALLEKIQQESRAEDKGLAARLERAARMVAILRGLGYAGAYLGGEHRADRVRWIVRRSEAIASRWEEFADQFAYAPSGSFYLFEALPSQRAAQPKRKLVARVLDFLARLFPVKSQGPLRAALTKFFSWVHKSPAVERGVERLEFAIKRPLFGCEACGNCILGTMEYVCPQTCPKNLRNGPCGGTFLGRCEVVDKPCIWTEVHDRAKAAHRVDDLRAYVPPRNLALRGTSSWVNYFLGLDNRPGRSAPLYHITPIPSPESQPANSADESKELHARR
ncbi:MAG TPA: methylenetetrahydrofolate reductase C-terminal domain-containing protein [Candidatus Methylomirabilis sp.]|nr:methylenetetrahydrofolate reductase C-terminal domain-containing protein [Candidatus Methylomirabilis sp.]